jgi:hypothetical protein
MQYATEAYRRKKYDPVYGTRFWDYGEVWPGIRWGIIDYYRVPKLSYYSVKHAQARFALNFAYEEALESQVSGKRLQIPAWIINDYAQSFDTEVRFQIEDLSGRVVSTGTFNVQVPADGKAQAGTVDWIAPESPGVYVLRGQARASESNLEASASTFIKVTPRLFSRTKRVLLIGQRKYSVHIAELVRAVGMSVDVIDERSLGELNRLRDAEQLRQKYDVVWLASFDSLWKVLGTEEAEGLKKAIHEGMGFVHTGGRGSFHGGFGEGACLDFTPLADVLPVEMQSRYDLVLGEANERTQFFSMFSLLKDIRATHEGDAEWGDSGLEAFGLPGFNDTHVKSGVNEVLSISGHPLLVVGRYGQGRTVAFTGFTPAYSDQRADWDSKIIFPYLVDQELYRRPAMRAYLHIFMELLVAASGDKPQVSFEKLLEAREKPLFETLKDIPTAKVEVLAMAETQSSGADARLSVRVTNGDRYARLLRFRTEWENAAKNAPYLVLYDDDYFDLMPGESRTIKATLLSQDGKPGHISGRLIVSGTNVDAREIRIKF